MSGFKMKLDLVSKILPLVSGPNEAQGQGRSSNNSLSMPIYLAQSVQQEGLEKR